MEKIKKWREIIKCIVSIKCWWRWNDAVYVLHNERNEYIRAQYLLKKIEDQFHVI